MGKRIKAFGVGVKHFFRSSADHSALTEYAARFKQSPKVLRAGQVGALVAMYVIAKHSPIGIGKTVSDSIKVARWNYGDMKHSEQNVDDFLETTNLSEEGKKKVRKLLKKGSAVDYEQFSYADEQELRTVFGDICVEAGLCVNF
ncbi:hypothetical protein GCM10011611_11080 [Aliidongia dinghuensis]|uniref:Uncharacterized protein n=1 Tax=Aliidongia dinghuensis TaxID=1867774 RepID=A0A8J2YQI8_9PROT|nr:hypothetical protein [Aliidongia dinghuensis]GGF07406.1 hypothetical protein GCM10011611_11080 [Aliidongia dinghuensis]